MSTSSLDRAEEPACLITSQNLEFLIFVGHLSNSHPTALISQTLTRFTDGDAAHYSASVCVVDVSRSRTARAVIHSPDLLAWSTSVIRLFLDTHVSESVLPFVEDMQNQSKSPFDETVSDFYVRGDLSADIRKNGMSARTADNALNVDVSCNSLSLAWNGESRSSVDTDLSFCFRSCNSDTGESNAWNTTVMLNNMEGEFQGKPVSDGACGLFTRKCQLQKLGEARSSIRLRIGSKYIFEAEFPENNFDEGSASLCIVGSGKIESDVRGSVKLIGNAAMSSCLIFRSFPSSFSISAECFDVQIRCECVAAESLDLTSAATFGVILNKIAVVGSCSGRDAVELPVAGFLNFSDEFIYQPLPFLFRRVGSRVNDALLDYFRAHTISSGIDIAMQCDSEAVLAVPPEVSRQLFEAAAAPVVHLLNTSGKSWRSLLFLSLCGAIRRGSARRFQRFAVLAEMLHTGSLIIDDIEDNSLTRRGAPCVHRQFGVGAALNSGTLCYFLAPNAAGCADLPPLVSNQIYALLFETLRLGHLGQGMDIHGFVHLLPDVVSTGRNLQLLNLIDATHKYKSGQLVGCICALAGILNECDAVTVSTLTDAGVLLGWAYQIINDVSAFSSFQRTGEPIEDVQQGKISYPVAVALGCLSEEEDRKELCELVTSKDSRSDVSQRVVALVESCGAAVTSLEKAKLLIQGATDKLSSLLPNSIHKALVLAFCSYIMSLTHTKS